MQKTTLSNLFDYCTAKSLPFAFYRLPNTTDVKVVAQGTTKLKSLPAGSDYIYEQGFIFSPFQEDAQSSRIIIRPDVFTTEERLPARSFAKPVLEPYTEPEKKKLPASDKASFVKYVRKIRRAIRKGKFRKAVAARVLKKDKPEDFNPVNFYKALCAKYPTTFISMVYTRDYGLWIGASPEILLTVDGNGFTTYSLAGTKANSKWNEKTGWGKKELDEQEIVSEYILNAFRGLSKSEPIIAGPDTVKAGNLLHLRTTFTYDNLPHYNWQKVVEQLHPTPAVAGLSKQDAIDFILKHEGFNRSYYSGYLGPVNLDEQINLYVNLRCMQVLKKKIAIYVGCGITADSKPVKEWRETKMKAQTLLSVLNDTAQGFKVTRNISPLPPDEHGEKGDTTNSSDLQAGGH